MPTDAPSISVLIPVKDDAARLRRCLASIAAQGAPPGSLEVLVADNGSGDGSGDVARAAGATVLVVPGLRVAAARNRLAAEARAPLLAFVDADHRLEPGWLAAALDALGPPETVAAGAPYRSPEEPTWVQTLYGALRRHAESREETRWLGSGNIVVRRVAFERVQGFDDRLTACEDVDLCNRLRAAGGRLVNEPRLRSIHDGDPRTLGHLFRAERWRGRDNVRVSLRGPVTAADLPSIAIPLAQAALLVAAPLAAALGAFLGAALALLAVLGLSALRAALLLRRGALGIMWAGRALLFALTYDLARAIALLFPAGHHRDPVRSAARRPPVRILELRSVFGTGGGPEKTILLGAARTDPARYAVTVCYLRDARDPVFSIADRASPLGIDYVEVIERHSLDVGIIPRLRRLIRERRIDIVHAHDHKTDPLTLLLAKLEGVIPLTTAHGYTGRSAKELRIYYPLDRRILRFFPITIAVSEDLRQVAIAHGAEPSRVRTIVNGIDARRFHRDRAKEGSVRASLGIREGEVVLGSVGRLARQKRFDLLVRAYAELLPRHPSLRLLIAGEGEERPLLERVIDELRLPRSILLGNRSDIPLVHHAFDLFVQSSDYEGTPNAVLEAMALETPLVATTAGGTAQLVDDGVHGLLLAPGDAGALARRIEAALADQAGMRRWAEAARRRVLGELSFDARMRKVEAIYDELMATQPTPRTRFRTHAGAPATIPEAGPVGAPGPSPAGGPEGARP